MEKKCDQDHKAWWSAGWEFCARCGTPRPKEQTLEDAVTIAINKVIPIEIPVAYSSLWAKAAIQAVRKYDEEHKS